MLQKILKVMLRQLIIQKPLMQHLKKSQMQVRQHLLEQLVAPSITAGSITGNFKGTIAGDDPNNIS